MSENTKNFVNCLAASVLAVSLPVGAALASDQEPTAIVDDLSDSVTSIELMDYLYPGQEISLQDGEMLQIGYLESCVMEVVTGGTVVIGAERSEISGGSVEREDEGCGGTASIEAADGEVVIGLSAVFRDIDQGAFTGEEASSDSKPKGPKVIYSQFPAVIADKNSMELEVQRMDQDEKPLSALMFDGKFDFARRNITLVKGGMYKFTVADKSEIVMISTGAGGEDVAVARRLVRLN